MPKINYVQADGKIIEVIVPIGLTVMHGAVINMVDGILAECGGAMTCATCHCYIDERWLDKTGVVSNQERQKLCLVQSQKANSRLSCQLTVDESFDGLVVHIPDSQVWSNK